MNYAIIEYMLGLILFLEGIFLSLPVLCSFIYHEEEGMPFLIMAALCFLLSFVATHKKPTQTTFFLREGCVTTALSWIVLSLVGAIPFIMTREIPSYLDALFETVSGFTTTGASIVPNVEEMSHTALLWRSFTHWIGGMGVLVFLLAIIPLTGGSPINLMRAESPGPSVGKLAPKIRFTARILYGIYVAITVIMFILLVIFGMPVFDAICTALGTAGTGGFGVKADSITGYSVPLQWIITVFMILFGINFNAYYLILLREFKKALALEEVRAYLCIIVFSTAIISWNILYSCRNLFDAVTKAAFQVGSIITTTGFCTADFDQWPSLSKSLLVLLMFVGACAGSTGGGSKVSRLLIIIKAIHLEIFSGIHPKSVRHIKMDNRTVDDEMLHGVFTYYSAYFIIFSLSTIPLFAEGCDLVTGFTAVVATFNNIGPGLSAVGPAANFADLGNLSKCVLIFDMLAGRLEIYPMLVLFSPSLWKEL